MRGRRVEVWHPESPGSRLVVWRPWWKRKDKPFASLWEWGQTLRWRQDRYGVGSAIGAPGEWSET